MTSPFAPALQYDVGADSRLEQLVHEYVAAKETADAAAARLKEITDAIKLIVTVDTDSAPKVDVLAPGAPPLRVSWIEQWRLDSKRLKAEHPETWVRYAEQSGYWQLKRVS